MRVIIFMIKKKYRELNSRSRVPCHEGPLLMNNSYARERYYPDPCLLYSIARPGSHYLIIECSFFFLSHAKIKPWDSGKDMGPYNGQIRFHPNARSRLEMMSFEQNMFMFSL
jgi:hypothetical protein